MTATYDGPTKTFEVYDGTHDIADLAIAKGSAPASDDKTYVHSGTSEGILEVRNTEENFGSMYVGYDTDDTDSAGTFRIYGGGDHQMPSSGYFKVNRDYGTFETNTTSKTNKALLDFNQCSNKVYLKGNLDLHFIDFDNIKENGIIDILYAVGEIIYGSFAGYNGASFIFEGVPGTPFHARSIDIGNAVSGLYTVAGEPDIDLVTDGMIVEIKASRGGKLPSLSVTGRRSARTLDMVIGPTLLNVSVFFGVAKYKEILKDIDYINTQFLRCLFVGRSHGSGGYPVDYLLPVVIKNPIRSYPPGIDYCEYDLNLEGSE